MHIIYILTNYNSEIGRGNLIRCLEIKRQLNQNIKLL